MGCAVRSALVFLPLVLLLGTPSTSVAQATAPFNLPSQPLAESLKALGSQANLNVMVAPGLVDGRQAPAVKDRLSAREALARLLEGTGLEYYFVNDQTVVIREKSSPTRPVTDTHKTGIDTAASAERPVGAGVGPTSDASRSSRESAAEPLQLEEIVVTAQKRSERMIDTPQSVSVISADALNALGAVQFRDFANTVPGLDFTTTGAGYNQISLRGVTAGFDVGSTVGVYVDDVPYGSSSSFAQGGQVALDVGLFDMDRIEILRGPQGTLYGASTMGGLIKYVSRQPNATELSGDLQTGLSTTQDGGISYNGAAAINMPLVTDKVALRASSYYSRDGGYIDNLALGQSDVNRSGVYGGRLDVLLTPTDALSIRIGGFLQDIARDGESTADYTLEGRTPHGALDQYRLTAEPFDQHFRLASATVAYNFGPVELTSISSYQTARTQLNYDVSGVYVQYCSFVDVSCSSVGLPQELSTNKITQEVRAASNGTGRFQWLVGGFYTRENSSNLQAFSLRDLSGQLSSSDLYHELNSSRYREYAAFVDLTYRLTDAFDVSGGVRYSQDHQSFAQDGSGAFGVTTPAADSSESVATYLANARYHFNRDTTGYLRYATGYRPGGPNFTLKNPVTGLPVGPPSFGPDRLKSYEAGIKAETADRRYSVDLAGYYIDWKDIRIAVSQNGFSGVENAAGATIRGAELTLSGRPSSSFAVTGAFAYQNARLSADVPDLGATDGERLPNVPRFTATLTADYRLPLAGLPLNSLKPSVGATLRYVTDRTASYDDNTSIEQYRLPAYTTLDLRTGLALYSVDLQVYVHNLFDERGQLSAFAAYSVPDQTKVSILQPRTVGISATTHF